MDLIGLRDEDLTDAERAERDTLLTEPRHAEEQRFAWQIAHALSPLAEAEGGPTALPRGSPRPWAALAVMALAASVLLAAGLAVGDDEVRWKGASPARGQVTLQAFAEGPDGLRPLPDGATVEREERVLFRVRTSRAGQLGVDEVADGVRAVVLPSASRGAGEHVPGGAQPMSWRPDRPLADAVYEARWCDTEQPDACVFDAVRLRWAAR